MLLTIKELGCTGFYFPVPQDCTRARLSLGARLPLGPSAPRDSLALGQPSPSGQPGPCTIPQHREVKPSASLLFYC